MTVNVSACYSNYCGWLKPICSSNTGTGWTIFERYVTKICLPWCYKWNTNIKHTLLWLETFVPNTEMIYLELKEFDNEGLRTDRQTDRQAGRQTDRQTDGRTDVRTDRQKERHAESICLLYTLTNFVGREYEPLFTAQDTKQLSVRKGFKDVHKYVDKKPNTHWFIKPGTTLLILLVETVNRIQRGSRQQLKPDSENGSNTDTSQGGE